MTCSKSCCLYDTLMDPWNIYIYMHVRMYVCMYVLCMYICMYAYSSPPDVNNWQAQGHILLSSSSMHWADWGHTETHDLSNLKDVNISL